MDLKLFNLGFFAFSPACYGIVQVPTGPWFCRKCESQERAARVRCELCPHKDGALKRTDNGGWAHVVCALYIPEVQFANVLTMEPIVLQYVPHDRFNKTCYICEEQGRESKAASGACMACNRHGCRQAFHVTCAQMAGLLCEEEVLEVDNVKYCGYCKYHFNKMVRSRNSRDSGSSQLSGELLFIQGISFTSRHSGTSSFLPGRRSRSASPAQEKHLSHHERPKKSRKDKERPKQKHKKRPDSPNSLPPAPVAMAGSSSHHEATKESSEVARAEAKGRKSSSHGSSHKGKKMGSGKSSAGFGSAPAGGTFQTAGSSCSLPGSQDFAPFPKLEQEDEKFRKATSSSSSSHCSPLSEGPKADVFEQKVIFSGFGSIMRFSTSAVGQPRARDASPVDYKASSTLGGPAGGTGGTAGAAGSGHKRMPSLGSEEGEVLKEKKHKGSKKNKHGPGRPKAGKGKEVLGAQLAGSTSTSSSPFSGGSLVSSSIGNSSRSFSHPGSLPSLSMESPLLGSGIYTSNKDPIPLGAALRAVCSTPLPSGLLPHQGGAALPQLSRSPFASSIPASSSAGSTTQVFSLAGSTFSLPSSHIFGSPLTSGLSLNPLLSQPESSRAAVSRLFPQEQQALVFQMMQQIQQKRELQRLQMSGSSQLSCPRFGESWGLGGPRFGPILSRGPRLPRSTSRARSSRNGPGGASGATAAVITPVPPGVKVGSPVPCSLCWRGLQWILPGAWEAPTVPETPQSLGEGHGGTWRCPRIGLNVALPGKDVVAPGGVQGCALLEKGHGGTWQCPKSQHWMLHCWARM
uniref:MLLT6, PHD finger containing n=1 Tax=Zonotrichia albicollis TaxID=44394 RepID=A0A8D2MCS7_ZONAL